MGGHNHPTPHAQENTPPPRGTRQSPHRPCRCGHIDFTCFNLSGIRAQHARFIAALSKAAEGASPGRLVVVSHHAPSLLSLPERRRDQLLSCAHASALAEFV
ncbi:MAG: hypothetical protein R3F11_15470 [Verrucomicrobiales bacterium]